MINVIKKLDDHLINQIAAGEVVDNPSSVVKELIENSIDAKSTEIDIIIHSGGHKKIIVKDNGIGINKKDINNAFERFATSKISSKNDLYNINTLGFRGEALPSIASVSDIKLSSKFKDCNGNEINIKAGKVKSLLPSSIEVGTKIEVNNLFYNVPARKKFLKKESYEYKNILKVYKTYALLHSDISFSLIHNDKIIYKNSKSTMYDRIIDIQGKEYNGNILEIDFTLDNYKVSGFIGNLSVLKKTRGNQYTYINDRYVYNRLINTTVLNTYGTLKERSEYPFYLLNVSVPKEMLDVNVHPKKIQVKFNNDLHIQHIVKKSIAQKLKSINSIIPKMYTNTENYENSLLELQFNKNDNFNNNHISIDKIISNDTDIITENVKVWQIHNKYLLTEISSGLVIIDQHVAHERILYESAKASLEGDGMNSQKLMFPITVNFDPERYESLIEIIPYLTKIGFDIRQFGQSSIIIEGSPSELPLGREKEVINDILDNYQENNQLNSSFIDYMAATYSCKAAIKAGDLLDDNECVNLINQLFATKHPYYCPHGRPIIINLTISDLDKRFERE